ncbi:MAG: cytidine deaminase [Actinomycetota bacterium]|nr:cytidine deaminase [Actinomycetota bacterium]
MNQAQRLIAEARTVAENSYSPYSEFRVGAVVIAADGTEYNGCNVENAAYGASICAEANAISTAAANGVRELHTVAVTCLDGQGCTPCGNCRQIMREFGVKRVILTDESGAPVEHTLDELLPMSFGPEDLRPSAEY